jgi:excisionase family DNA binding protein
MSRFWRLRIDYVPFHHEAPCNLATAQMVEGKTIMSKLLTIRQACAEYGMSRSSLYREIDAGRLTLRKIGKSSRIARDDLDAWLAALPVANAKLAA